MAKYIQVMVLICFSQIACRNMRSNEQSKEIFVQKVGYKSNNYIKFIKDGDSLKGIFYGVDMMPSSKKPVYYQSELDNIKIETDKMQFTLNTFIFSNKPLNYYQDDAKLMNDKPDSIPFEYNYPITYMGERKGDTLKLNRTTALDDSRFTESIFIKVK